MQTRVVLILLAVFFTGNALANEELPDLIIEEIQSGVYLHKSFSRVDGFGLVSSNGLIVVDNGKAFIIDTPWSERDTEKLVTWIKNKNYKLLGSISTHSHGDRTAGIKWLNAHSISTYASDLTNKLLEKKAETKAQKSFSGSEYSFAGGLVEAFYPGAGHTVDNIVIWLPKSNILFGGCLVRSLDSKSLGYTGEANIEKWPGSVDKVLQRYPSVKLVIPGHGKIGDIQLLKHTLELAQSASKKIESAERKGAAD